MKKKLFASITLVLLAFPLFHPVFGQEGILPLDQVKKGMKGKGKSVFTENRIEEFDVEILGVWKNILPQRSVILARLSSSLLEKSGIIQGMSGSPVYVDGKIIGAVAYSFPYAKEAIAGITPIEEMLSLSEEEPRKSTFSAGIPIQKHLTLGELFELNKAYFSSNPIGVVDGQTISALHIPLVFGGFTSRIFEKSKPFFSRFGFNPIQAGSSQSSREIITMPDLSLKEGEPVGAQLISGDLSLTAVGTVTYVEGNKVLAFGHPLYNLGKVDYMMTKEEVITVVPSLDASFKISATKTRVGMFSQDRMSGVFGEIGKKPRLVPLNVKILEEKGSSRNFKLEVVADKILSPFLVNVAVASILTAEERSLGDLSLEFSGDIFLDNGMSVHLEDLFSGNFDTSVNDLSSLVTAVVYFLSNNEFKDLGIHRIDLDITASEEVKFSYLDKVWLGKYDASPGESIQMKIYTRNFRGEVILHDGLSVPIPHLPSGSEIYLVIADSVSMHQLEASQYRSQAFVPRSLDQLIRLLNNLRKNNRIYLKIIASKPGLFLKGEEMPNLPPSMKSMFSSPRVATSSPTELDKSTLIYSYLPLPSVFKGAAIIPIKIK